MVEDVQYRSNSHMLKKRLFIKYVAREVGPKGIYKHQGN